MSLILILSGSLFFTGFVFMIRGLRTAPCGYEDAAGFHEGVPPYEEMEESEPIPAAPVAREVARAPEAEPRRTLAFRRSGDPQLSPRAARRAA